MASLVSLIDLMANLYAVILLARVILPMIGIDPYQPLMQVILRLTEPVLAPIRSILPQVGMFDFSPMVALILVTVVQSVLVSLLSG